MNDQLQTVVTIKSIVPRTIPTGAVVYDVETIEGTRFQFWEKKQDGTDTVAASQFKQFRFVGGDKVEVLYSESEGKPYLNNHTGKMTTPINRRIDKFEKQDAYTPSMPSTARIPIIQPKSGKSVEEINAEIQALTDRVSILEETMGINE